MVGARRLGVQLGLCEHAEAVLHLLQTNSLTNYIPRFGPGINMLFELQLYNVDFYVDGQLLSVAGACR